MAYCRHCGVQIEDTVLFCPSCGVRQEIRPEIVDNGGFGWSLLGFLLPLVGLVLFLVWRDFKPRTSKAAGKGALIRVLLHVGFALLLFL